MFFLRFVFLFIVCRMWAAHVLGVCALALLAKSRSIVPTAQGTNDWTGLSHVQGLKPEPALPLKREVAIVREEDKAPEVTSPERGDVAIQQPEMYAGSERDEALKGLEGMFQETEEYADETTDEEEGLTTTEPDNLDYMDGLCMVRTILYRLGLSTINVVVISQ